MIPSDLATRLRAFIESQVNPLVAASPVADELPPFETGQQFTAQIQNPLPDGTFRALVAGRTLTLALPDSAKAGDVLELVVTGRDGDTLTARPAATPEQAMEAQAAQARPALSQTGRLISQLLTGRFAQEAAVPLKGGEPLVAAPPTRGSQIAPQLQQAVSRSGLFFEAHQAQWVAGSLPLSELLAEPQAALTRPLALPLPLSPTLSPAPALPLPPAPAATAPEAAQQAVPPSLADTNEADGVTPLRTQKDASMSGPTASFQRAEQQSAALAAAIERTIPPSERDSLRIPDRLMPLVHQQLEALASHQITWQGQVWPGQQMQWTVFDPEQEGGQRGSEDEATPWSSTLKLTLPRLGGISAHLLLSPGGLNLRLEAEDAATAERLMQERQALADALTHAGIPLTTVSITRGGGSHGGSQA